MKKILVSLVAITTVFMMVACGDLNTGDSDRSVDNTVNYGDGDVLLCTDANCTLSPVGTDAGDGDAVVGVYDADYTQAECTSAGFFFCTIENVCLDQPLSSGTCGGAS